MGDFFAPPPGFPDVPPAPSTPPPNFEQIGGGIATGIANSPLVSGFLAPLFNILMSWSTAFLGTLLSFALKIFAFFIRLLLNIEDEASTGYGALVSATLKDLLGVNVDPSVVASRAPGPGRQAAANAMGQAIIGTLFSQVQANPSGGITPSDGAVNNYLGVVMNMELNGWLESWFNDAVSYHLLEKYGDLKDGIARVLGLGRMSRQVFAPPLKVLVHDPYLQLLQQKYRPKLVDAGTAIQAFLRAEFDRDTLSSILALQGYTEQEIDWLIRQHAKYLSVDDMNYLIARGTWTIDQGITQLGFQGWDPASAQHLLEIAADKELQAYRKEAINVAEAAFVDGNLDLASWQNLVSGSGLTDVEQSWILSIANIKRQSKVTHLSLGQIEQGVVDGIMSLTDVKTWANRVNMPADEEAYLELMILFKQNKATATAAAKAAAAKAKAAAAQAKVDAAAAKATAAKALAADKGVTVAQAETLVKEGAWTFDHLTAFLTAKGYGGDAIDAIVTLLHNAIDTTAAKTATATTVRAAAGAKGLNLATTEKAVVAGILTIDDLQKYLAANGFDAADAQIIVDLTEEAAATAQTKAAAKASAVAKAADKQLSLPELEHAVRLGLTPIATYNTALTAAGFDAMSIALLDGILNAQIATDKATASKRAGLATAGAAAGISIAQLEQEVINGIRPIADYSNTLAQLGYSPADQTDLTQLLQLKVDGAKQTAAKKAAAGATLGARGISLGQAETAVKLGVLPIATYQQQLQTAGFTADAVDVLSNSLLAEVAKTSKTQVAANGATTALAAKKISLPDIEKAVIAGIQPIDTYTNTLTQNGYSSADADTLTQLLQLKVDHANQAAAMHADAVGQATQKGISLANEEAAVIAGDVSMDDYDALLTQLGYDVTDRGILEQLLQLKVAAAAAKAGTAAPATSGGAPASGSGS
jgi:hypothetical protein